jgi:hypothetical protein
MEETEKLFYSKDIQKIASKLKGLNDLKTAYELAETYCNKTCKKWLLSPMVSCAYNCEIWKLKNEILRKKQTQGI